ncbi:metalloregulator ArsR/SmtB family transcription factor [Nonomuraea sp. MTCD27]|uniref:metalloregulator ArsR/SmtB family transcription factor n=1 Tax=Nonomuraea sp. MTCD27 TaxID=1676747 RepID=UPI0035C1DA5A
MAATTTPCCAPIAREPLSETDAADLALMLKAVADPVRLRLLSMIGSHAGGEACVCDLTDAFDLTAPTISHHLKVLRTAGLIDGERRGTWVYYRIVPETVNRLGALFTPLTAPAPVPVSVSVPAQLTEPAPARPVDAELRTA